MRRRNSAIGWAYGLAWGRQGIQAATTMTLAAIVGPADFGVMALALIYVGFIELVLHQGFVAAIIQRKVLRQVHVSSVFWLSLAFSTVLACAGAGLSGYWAAANDTPLLGHVIAALSVTIPMVGLGMVPTALLTRHFKFRALMMRNVVAALASAAASLPLAFLGWGVWALVAMHVTYTATSTVTVLREARWRPSLTFSWAAARSLLPFSLANFAARMADFVASQSDAIVIGMFWGPAAVGLYRLAARCVTMSLEFLAAPLQFVSFPEFSRLQADSDRLRESLLAYLSFAAVLTWPFLATVGLLAPFVPVFIGARWDGIQYPLLPLTVYGALITVTEYLGPLLKAVGRPATLALLVWSQAVLGAVAFTALGYFFQNLDWSAQAAAIGSAKALTYALIPLPAFLYFARRALSLSVGGIVRAVWPGALSAAAVLVVGGATRGFLRAHAIAPIGQVAILATVAATAWLITAVAFSDVARRTLAALVKTATSLQHRPQPVVPRGR